jgi:hypothetical protein
VRLDLALTMPSGDLTLEPAEPRRAEGPSVAVSSAPSDAIELGRRRTLAQLRRCFYGQHRIGVIGVLGLQEATRYGAQLRAEAWHDAVALHGDRPGARVRGAYASHAPL